MNTEFDLIDNFKRRYAGLSRINEYIYKWQNNKHLKFSIKEQEMFNRMHISIDKKIAQLEKEFLFINPEGDIEELHKYLYKK